MCEPDACGFHDAVKALSPLTIPANEEDFLNMFKELIKEFDIPLLALTIPDDCNSLSISAKLDDPCSSKDCEERLDILFVDGYGKCVVEYDSHSSTFESLNLTAPSGSTLHIIQNPCCESTCKPKKCSKSKKCSKPKKCCKPCCKPKGCRDSCCKPKKCCNPCKKNRCNP